MTEGGQLVEEGAAVVIDGATGDVCLEVGDFESTPGAHGEGGHAIAGEPHGFGHAIVAVMVDSGAPQNGLPTVRERRERFTDEAELGSSGNGIRVEPVSVLVAGGVVARHFCGLGAGGAFGGNVADRGAQVGTH